MKAFVVRKTYLQPTYKNLQIKQTNCFFPTLYRVGDYKLLRRRRSDDDSHAVAEEWQVWNWA